MLLVGQRSKKKKRSKNGFVSNNCFESRLGGLDLSRSRLSISTLAESRSRQSRFSRQFEKRHLDSRDFLNSLKNDISTNLDNFYAIKSQFLFLSRSRLSISTVQKPTSRHFKKVSLDAKDVLDLDLDWSRLSRPPWLFESLCGICDYLDWNRLRGDISPTLEHFQQ